MSNNDERKSEAIEKARESVEGGEELEEVTNVETTESANTVRAKNTTDLNEHDENKVDNTQTLPKALSVQLIKQTSLQKTSEPAEITKTADTTDGIAEHKSVIVDIEPSKRHTSIILRTSGNADTDSLKHHASVSFSDPGTTENLDLRKHQSKDKVVQFHSPADANTDQPQPTQRLYPEHTFDEAALAQLLKDIEEQSKKVDKMKKTLKMLWDMHTKTESEILVLRRLQNALIKESYKLKSLIEEALEMKKRQKRAEAKNQKK